MAFIFVALVFLCACKSTKLVPQGKHLLIKNQIKSSDAKNNVLNKLSSSLNDDKAIYIKHKPNRKILGSIRFYLSTYNFATSVKNPYKNDSFRWRKYLREIGEAPTILDTLKVGRSEENLRNYLLSQGYFNCDISSKIIYRKKKAKVIYYINTSTVFLIDGISLSADDANIDKLLNDTLDKTYLIKNKPLEIDNIGKERNRLSSILRNKGYYNFTKDFIDFELDTLKRKIDTTWRPYRVRVNIGVSNKNDEERFVPKTIKTIIVNFENDIETQENKPYIIYDNINMAFNGYPLKPYIIAKNITLRPGDLFKQNELENTYNKLSELPIFKFIDITFKTNSLDSIYGLDIILVLKTSFRKSYSIEPQGLASQLNRIQNVNYSNSYGIANNLTFTNKNAFKNAEQLDITSNTRIEAPFAKSISGNGFDFDNRSIQQGLNFSLLIPRSAFLTGMEKWKHVKSIKTNLNASFLYEFNPDYVRRILPLTYQYQIRSTRTNWFLNLAEISFSRNTLSNSVNLNKRKDSAFIQRLFANNMVASSGLNFIFSNKATTTSKSSIYIRGNVIEFGGNMHRVIRRLADKTKDADTAYKLLGVNFFQYAKSEIDARCSTILDENSSTAIRLNIGVAYPYGNQKILPFDKLFFIGGANSLRAWRPRTIGPGSYIDSSQSFSLDRAGDFIFQANAEYRFDFIKPLELAIFLDAGNVWLSRNNQFTDAKKILQPKNFLSDMALNSGIGVRVDFSFFLFRLDWGWQLHNPEKPTKDAWVIKDFAQNKYFSKYAVLNFGIGYPF